MRVRKKDLIRMRTALMLIERLTKDHLHQSMYAKIHKIAGKALEEEE